MGGSEPFARPDPAGATRAAPFTGPEQYFEALLEVVLARAAAAIHDRWASGLLAESGDAAAALFLDRRRVEGLLQRSSEPTRAADEQREAAAQHLARLRARLEASRARRQPLPFADACAAWGLDEDDTLLLACAIGAEVSPTLARLLAYLGGDATRPGLTVEAAAATVRGRDGGVVDLLLRLGDERPLRRLGLLTLRGAAELPLLRRTLSVAPRLFALLRGDGAGGELPGDIELVRAPSASLAVETITPAHAAQLRTLLERSSAAAPVGVVVARRGVGATRMLADLATLTGRPALVVRSGAAPLDDERLAALLREALLHRAAIVWSADPPSDGEARLATALDRLASAPVPVVLVLERAEAPTPRPAVPVLRVDVPVPDAAVRHRLWSEVLGPTEINLDTIASAYHVGAETIERAAAGARALAGAGAVEQEQVAAAMRAQVASDLSAVATRLDITQSWGDLVLPDDLGDLVLELVQRGRLRRQVLVDWGFARKVGKGLGLIALFSGRPGTGKSMVAGLIARELGLDAYQIDISRILSKWIGETEKSLGLAFEAAEAGQALLIFDEADALFGKRVTDVKSSSDRYANVETNYILNRLEWFTGIAVLTTNLEGNLDPAFRRRVTLHAQFPLPDEHGRALLWRTIIPPETPLAGDIPYDELARDYQLSGGQIRNVALRAAFLAAAAGEALSLAWIRVAAERQYRAYGKLMIGGELE